MPRSSSRKRKPTAKVPPSTGGQAGARRTLPNNASEKSQHNTSVTGRRKPGGAKIGPAGARRSTSRQQGDTGRTREARPPKRRRIEHVESVPEPQILASSLLPAKRRLSDEARELLAKVAEGGIPLMMTRNLERIANEHGITVSADMSPDEVVRLLRDTGDQRLGKPKTLPDIFTNIIWPDAPSTKSDE